MGGTLKKIILFLIVLFVAISGHSQSVFNKAFDEGGISNSTTNSLEAFGQYFFVQKIYKNNNTYLEAVKLDKFGQVLLKNDIVKHPVYNIYYGFPGSFQILSTNEFCQLYHIALDTAVNLVFFNSNFQVIRTKKFSFRHFVNPAIIKQINDSTLLTLGRIRNSSTYDLFLINTDLQGNERWRIVFGEPFQNDYGRSIEVINNKIIIGGQTYESSSLAHPHLYQFQTDGVLIKDTIYSDFDNGGALTFNVNYGLFLSSSIYETNSVHPAILKIDTDLSIVWAKEYFTHEPFVSLGTIVVNESGTISNIGYSDVNNIMTGLFFQINHLGDSLGSKLLEHLPGKRSQFLDIRPTSDGGYVMAGQTSAPSQDSWIVKVNAWGCDNIPCVVGVEEVVEETGSLLCYPNPTSSNGVIQGFVEQVQNARVIIYNSLGQEVQSLKVSQSDFELAVNLPAQGIYLVVLSQNGKVLKQQKWVVE